MLFPPLLSIFTPSLGPFRGEVTQRSPSFVAGHKPSQSCYEYEEVIGGEKNGRGGRAALRAPWLLLLGILIVRLQGDHASQDRALFIWRGTQRSNESSAFF